LNCATPWNAESQILGEPFHRCLECTLFPSLDAWIRYVASHSETVTASGEVLSVVSRGELSVAENGIGLSLRFEWEGFVDLTAVDEQWCLGYRRVFLKIVWNHKTRGVRDSGDLEDVVECEVKHKARPETEACSCKSDNTLGFQSGDDTVNYGTGLRLSMRRNPFLAVEIGLRDVSLS